MKTVQVVRFTPRRGLLSLCVVALVTACGSAPSTPAPNINKPASSVKPIRNQSWIGAPRVSAPEGSHQMSFGSVEVGETLSSSMALLRMPGQPDNAGFEMDSCPTHARWEISADDNTLTRQIDCNGTRQYAVLQRASQASYLGYYSDINAVGAVTFGPIRMTRQYPEQTGMSPEWNVQWAVSTQTQLSGDVGIEAGGSQSGCANLKYSFVDDERHLERVGDCGGGATSASLGRVGDSSQYAGFHAEFADNNTPSTLGAFALRRP